jgi:hypothetical protein
MKPLEITCFVLLLKTKKKTQEKNGHDSYNMLHSVLFILASTFLPFFAESISFQNRFT